MTVFVGKFYRSRFPYFNGYVVVFYFVVFVYQPVKQFVGLAFYMKDSLSPELQKIMLVGGVYVYIIFFAISLGPLGWLLISEIYPLKIRGFASSMGSFNHWLFDAGVAYSFPILFGRDI